MYPEEKTKKCPFCAEIILAEAVKCRHCGEFLIDPNTSEPRSPFPQTGPAPTDPKLDFCYLASPSLLAGVGAYFKGLVIIGLAIFLMNSPLEKYLVDMSMGQFVITESHAETIAFYRHIACINFIVLGGLIITYKIFQLKATGYEVTPDRIEWSRGIFDRKIDNIDMFRIIDIKLHRSLLDCLFGIGTITVITKDETDPFFMFYKIRSPKKLYNILKTSYLEADRKQNVFHLD